MRYFGNPQREMGVKEQRQESVLAVGSFACIRGENCNRNRSVTQRSEPLIEDLKESYGYTSNMRIEGLSWFSTSEHQFSVDE
jgi:hypothetical protein